MEEQEQINTCNRNKVGKKHKTTSKSSVETDRISALPDCLLQHILSSLTVPDAVKTIVLSKRWRNIWTWISSLDFYSRRWERKTDKVTFIDKSLSLYKGTSIVKLRIPCYCKETDDNKIDSWINFAVSHNVEALVLDLSDGDIVPNNLWIFNNRYRLHNSIYDCRTLKMLLVSFCDLNLPASINLRSLKILWLEMLDVHEETLTSLTSSCPVLKNLHLNGCNKRSDLIINIQNPSLEFLELFEYGGTDHYTKVIIDAPYLTLLRFNNALLRKEYHIKNMESLEYASFIKSFNQLDHDRVYDEKDAYKNVFVGLLRDLYYVDQLSLSLFLIQVLSIRAVQGIHPLYFDATYLELETEFNHWDLPGISCLLKSCPKLESLCVNMPESSEEIQLSELFKEKFGFNEKGYWESEKCNSTLQSLQRVELCFLSDTQEYGDMEEILKKLENRIEFAQFLLKNTKELKTMIIRCGSNFKTNYNLQSKLTKELKEFPRASSTAKIYLY